MLDTSNKKKEELERRI